MGQYDETMQSLEPKSSGGRGPLIALLAAVAVLCAAGVFFLMQMQRKTPEQAVLSAVRETFQQAGRRLEAIEKSYPAYSAAEGFTLNDSAKLDYSLGFTGIEGVEYAHLISTFLSGSSLDFSVARDVGANAVDLDMALSLFGQPFMEGGYYLSPELLAVSVPTFTDTVVSVDPRGFAQKYPLSPLGRLQPASAQQLAAIQEQLDAYTSQLRAIDPQAAGQLSAGMKEIGLRALESAEFSELEEGRYRVTVPGGDARQLLIDTMKLCVGFVYTDEVLGQRQAGGQTMREQLEDAYAEIPPLDTVVELSVSGKTVSAATLTITAGAAPGGGRLPFGSLVLSYALEDGNGHAFDLTARDGSGDDFLMRCTFSGDEQKSTYQERLSLTAGDAARPDLVGFTWDYSVGKDGSIRHEGAFSVPDERLSVGFSAVGSLLGEKDAPKLDFPEVRLSMSGPYQPNDIVLLLNFTLSRSPLDRPLAAPQATDLLSMNERELTRLIQEYEDGVAGLEGKLYGMLLG